jgi:hypothetical protein
MTANAPRRLGGVSIAYSIHVKPSRQHYVTRHFSKKVPPPFFANLPCSATSATAATL